MNSLKFLLTAAVALASPALWAAGQVVYLPQLPTADQLTQSASTEGRTIARIDQTGNQVTVVYNGANGQSDTVSYQLLPQATSAAGGQTYVPPPQAYAPPAPQSYAAPTMSYAPPAAAYAPPAQAPVVTESAPPTTVVYETAPAYDYAYPYGYPYGYYPTGYAYWPWYSGFRVGFGYRAGYGYGYRPYGYGYGGYNHFGSRGFSGHGAPAVRGTSHGGATRHR